jgi:hypothetical protein
VPVVAAALPIFGYAEANYAWEFTKGWLAYVGPFAGVVLGFYFKQPK